MKETKPQKGLKDDMTEQHDVFGNIPPVESELLEALNESNGIAAISLLRIYDVLMCMYAETNEDDARALIELHNNGKLRAQLPWLDLVNTGE